MQNRKEKVHMNYEEFKERFIEEVKEKLAEQGYDGNLTIVHLNVKRYFF